MHKFTQEDKDKAREYVIENLITCYHYERLKAETSVKNSVFNIMLKEEPDFVFHYSVEYWAKHVDTEVTLCSRPST